MSGIDTMKSGEFSIMEQEHDSLREKGSQQDDVRDMARLGKKQQFDRNFQFLSISAFSVVAMGGWIFVPNNATYGLFDGNTGGTIVMYLVNFASFSSIILSLAEMSSMAPTAGGQYHWASEFAPPGMQKILSYIAGWLSSLAWCCGTSSGFFLAGALTNACIFYLHPGYSLDAWKAYLFILALTTLGLLVNTYLSRLLPKLEGIALIVTLTGFGSIIIALWVLGSDTRLSASEVFGTFTNDGGWSSLGLSMMAGQILLVWTLTGSDATAHMAEETRNAGLVIPRAMWWSYVLNGCMVFLMLITYCFQTSDLAHALNSPTYYPFIEIFTHAVGSREGSVAITGTIIGLIVFSVTNYMASCSRQVFAFGRDKGLPFYEWMSKVDTRTNAPVRAIIVVYFFVILICLIDLGSNVAFNAITSLQLLALVFTYMLTISTLVYRRIFGEPLPYRQWSLGRAGIFINIYAICYSTYLIIFICFPTTLPVTLAYTNWAPLMFVGVVILASLYYAIHARHVYEGPVVYVNRLD